MKLISGPANSGKSERIISRAAAALAGSRSGVWIIVPSTKDAEQVSRRLQAKLAAQSIKSLRPIVTTFPQLYEAILTHHQKWVRRVGPIERERVLRNVISELAGAGKLSYFAATATRPGLVAALSDLIDDLWRSGVEPDRFANLTGHRGAKDKDIALIFEQYKAALAAINAMDAECAGLEALKSLRAENRKLEQLASLVAADGFDFYTPVQVELLALLSRRGVETIASLTYEEGRAVHLWQERTRARLIAAGGVEVSECSANPCNSIERAAANLLRIEEVDPSCDNSPASTEGEAIEVISAPDRAAEVRAVAHEIKRLVIERGYTVADITVISRALSVYRHHLERVFSECSIPLTLDCPAALGDVPVVIAMLRLLSLHATSFARRACIDCLRQPFFDWSVFGLDERQINLIDRASREANITRSRKQWIESLEAAAQKTLRRSSDDYGYEEPRDRTVERYALLCESLNRFFDALTFPATATRRELAQSVKRLIERLNVESLSAQHPAGADDRLAIEEFMNLLDAVADERRAIDGGRAGASQHEQPVSWPVFYGELERAVATAKLERAACGDTVLAQEAHALRAKRFRAVFVIGLIEGEFPARISERAPYTFAEREELRLAGIDFAETANDPGADLSHFHKAMTRASERLYLTYARTDLAGGELLKSYLVDEVAAVAPVKELRIAQSFSPSAVIPDRDIGSLEELALFTARAMRDTLTGQGPVGSLLDGVPRAAAALLNERLKSWPATVRGARVEWSRIEGADAGGFSGMIRNAELLGAIEKMFGAGHYWNAGQINDYGTCPFRFFARHALRLAPAVEPADGFAADRLGTAYHRILERVYLELMNEPDAEGAFQPEHIERQVEQAAEGVLDEMLSDGDIRKGVLWDFEKDEIKKQTVALILKEAEWNRALPSKPVAFERRFGIEGTKPLKIADGEEQINICGIIDRIDEREDGCVVIDYKTPRSPMKHSDALDGRNLQLPIYMLAAREVVMPEKRVASAYYLHIRSRKRGSEFPHRDNERLSVEAIMERAQSLIRDYVARVRSGAFPIRPNGDRCPPRCDFDQMCRIGSLRAAQPGSE